MLKCDTSPLTIFAAVSTADDGTGSHPEPVNSSSLSAPCSVPAGTFTASYLIFSVTGFLNSVPVGPKS